MVFWPWPRCRAPGLTSVSATCGFGLPSASCRGAALSPVFPKRPLAGCGVFPSALLRSLSYPINSLKGPCPSGPHQGQAPNSQGKEMETHGVSVRATRKPLLSRRSPAAVQSRFVERRCLGPLLQEPPRKTRSEQLPSSHALPSSGASPPYDE